MGYRFSGAIRVATGRTPRARNVPRSCQGIILFFVLAFQGAFPHQDYPFNHDDSLIPAGYFKAHASKKRSMNQSEGGREASRPKRSYYTLSDE